MRELKDKKLLDILRCPVCQAGMRVSDNCASLLCCGAQKTHCYDFASSGYVSLASPDQSGGGDSKVAVRARSDFLNTGYYLKVAQTVDELVLKHANKSLPIIDAGCGEGYYSMFPAKNGFSVYGVDLSKFAVDAAAKRAVREGIENAFFSTASVFKIPVADFSVGAVINIFAPCVEQEFSRVLAENGVLIVAYAGENHLLGLKGAIYDNIYANNDRADLPVNMKKIDEQRVRYTIDLESNSEIMSLFAMTPYYWRTSVSDAQKLVGIDKLSTEVDIIISVFGKTN